MTVGVVSVSHCLFTLSNNVTVIEHRIFLNIFFPPAECPQLVELMFITDNFLNYRKVRQIYYKILCDRYLKKINAKAIKTCLCAHTHTHTKNLTNSTPERLNSAGGAVSGLLGHSNGCLFNRGRHLCVCVWIMERMKLVIYSDVALV